MLCRLFVRVCSAVRLFVVPLVSLRVVLFACVCLFFLCCFVIGVRCVVCYYLLFGVVDVVVLVCVLFSVCCFLIVW